MQLKESGLLVPAEKPTAPPEHPVRQKIREALAALQVELEQFEHTTHGRFGHDIIHSVARDLVACYETPTAYSISDLSQAIGNFLKDKP